MNVVDHRLLAEAPQIARRALQRGAIRFLPDPAKSDFDRLHGKVRRLAKQQLHRLDLNARGLTILGTPRKQRQHPQLARYHGAARRNAWLRLRTKEIAERGLTTRGTPRKNKFTPRFRKET